MSIVIEGVHSVERTSDFHTCIDPSICQIEMFLRLELMWLVNILRWNVLTTAFLTSCPAHISRLNESSFLHFLSTQICKCMQDRAGWGWTLNSILCFVSSGSAWSLDIIVGKCGQDERIPDMPGPALLVCNRNLITHPACVYVYPQYSHHAYPEHPLSTLKYVTEMCDTARDISEEIAETEWPGELQSVLSSSVTRMGEQLSPCQGPCHQDYHHNSYPIPPPPPPPHLQDLLSDCQCSNQNEEISNNSMSYIVFNKYFLVIICILCVVILLIICIYMIICAVNNRFVSFLFHEPHWLFMFQKKKTIKTISDVHRGAVHTVSRG